MRRRMRDLRARRVAAVRTEFPHSHVPPDFRVHTRCTVAKVRDLGWASLSCCRPTVLVSRRSYGLAETPWVVIKATRGVLVAPRAAEELAEHHEQDVRDAIVEPVFGSPVSYRSGEQ